MGIKPEKLFEDRIFRLLMPSLSAFKTDTLDGQEVILLNFSWGNIREIERCHTMQGITYGNHWPGIPEGLVKEAEILNYTKMTLLYFFKKKNIKVGVVPISNLTEENCDSFPPAILGKYRFYVLPFKGTSIDKLTKLLSEIKREFTTSLGLNS